MVTASSSVEEVTPTLTIRADNAGEYHSLEPDLAEMGVSMEFTSTYTVYQNGVAERFNRIVTTIARAMLEWSGLPLSFWALAIEYVCFVYNMLPQGARGSKSPFELWFKKKPDLSGIRVFGCVCRVLLAKEQRVIKLHPVSYLGIYVGCISSTQSRVYWPERNRFEWPTNVKCYEDRPGKELIPQSLLPKFKSIRAEEAPKDLNDVMSPSDDAEDSMHYVSSDDDDAGDAGGPGE